MLLLVSTATVISPQQGDLRLSEASQKSYTHIILPIDPLSVPRHRASPRERKEGVAALSLRTRRPSATLDRLIPVVPCVDVSLSKFVGGIPMFVQSGRGSAWAGCADRSEKDIAAMFARSNHSSLNLTAKRGNAPCDLVDHSVAKARHETRLAARSASSISARSARTGGDVSPSESVRGSVPGRQRSA